MVDTKLSEGIDRKQLDQTTSMNTSTSVSILAPGPRQLSMLHSNKYQLSVSPPLLEPSPYDVTVCENALTDGQECAPLFS